MTPTPADQISLYRGAALDGGRFAALASFDRHEVQGEPYYPLTAFDTFDYTAASWDRIAVRDWFGAAVARYARPDDSTPRAVVLSQGGDVLIDAGALVEERVIEGKPAPMTKLNQTEWGLYAVGASGHFFIRDKDRNWVVISNSLYEDQSKYESPSDRIRRLGDLSPGTSLDSLSPEEQDRLTLLSVDRKAPFYGIDGFAFDDLYLAGQNGAMLHFDGIDMHRIETGEKSTLTNVIARDGVVYVAGAHRGAVIMKGTREAGFEAIFRAPVKDIWLDTMTFHGDDIYIGDPEPTTGGLYKFRLGEDGGVTKISEIAAPIWKVDAIDGVLWAMEAKAVNRYDGERWERFIHPDG